MLLSTAVVLYALVYTVWWTWPAAGVLVAAAFGWSRRGRQPHFDWLGCTAHGRWWLATAEGLRQERIHDIEILPDTRVFSTRVVLRYRPAGGGRPGTLWLYPGRVDADDLRRLRMRLRWPAPGPAEWVLAWRTAWPSTVALSLMMQRMRRGEPPYAAKPPPPMLG